MISLRPIVLTFACAAALSAAAFARERFSVTQNSGSGGAQAFLQTTATGGALQGETASTTNASIRLPFGVLGEYDAAGSTFGIGVVGISTTGYAVGAEALSAQPSILAYAGGNGIGLEATTPASSPAESIYGESKGTGDGADLVADQSGYGAYGANTSAVAPGPSAPPNYNAGVYGISASGTGVFGMSKACVSAPNCHSYGFDLQKGAGVFGYGSSGPGVEGFSGFDYGVVAANEGEAPTLLVENETGTASGGISVEIDGETDGALTQVYSNGGFYTSGSITSGTDTFNAVSRNPAAAVMTYSAQQTQATVEDIGHAELARGSATVALAADFRQTIAANVPYDVFLTPYGDTRGLYVASRSPSGFVVRENQGGRSTLDFSYRVVAEPFGAPHERLPRVSDRIRHRTLVLSRPGRYDASRSPLLRGAPPAIRPMVSIK